MRRICNIVCIILSSATLVNMDGAAADDCRDADVFAGERATAWAAPIRHAFRRHWGRSGSLQLEISKSPMASGTAQARHFIHDGRHRDESESAEVSCVELH
jgi:hypothetical protein